MMCLLVAFEINARALPPTPQASFIGRPIRLLPFESWDAQTSAITLAPAGRARCLIGARLTLYWKPPRQLFL
jgi:hypothetical protein